MLPCRGRPRPLLQLFSPARRRSTRHAPHGHFTPALRHFSPCQPRGHFGAPHSAFQRKQTMADIARFHYRAKQHSSFAAIDAAAQGARRHAIGWPIAARRARCYLALPSAFLISLAAIRARRRRARAALLHAAAAATAFCAPRGRCKRSPRDAAAPDGPRH